MPKNRPYQASHPWLTFEANLRKLPYTFWVHTGAVQSKARHIGETLLPPKTRQDLYSVFLAKGVHATTAIEGNTLSEAQVLQAVREGGLKVPRSKEYQEREVRNVIDACNDIADSIFGGRPFKLSVELFQKLNAQILNDLPVEEGVIPGTLRTFSVGVARYRAVPHQDCEYLLGRLCDWLNDSFESPSEDVRTGFAVLKAMIAHLYIAWIHPFGDGNGRTARLVEFAILLAAGVPDVCAHLLSNHYNQTRAQYYRELDYASRSKGDMTKFLCYAMQGFQEGLVEQIDLINTHQYAATWKEHIYNAIPEARTEPMRRQRQIALELWNHPDGVDENEIRYLTPRLAESYTGKQRRTVLRDLKGLEDRSLVVREKSLVRILLQRIAERRPRKILPGDNDPVV